MSKMRALAKLKREAGIWMTEAEIPQPGPNDLLIKIHKTAILELLCAEVLIHSIRSSPSES